MQPSRGLLARGQEELGEPGLEVARGLGTVHVHNAEIAADDRPVERQRLARLLLLLLLLLLRSGGLLPLEEGVEVFP